MSLPARIGPLRVERLLGEGGMGCVYRCVDEGLARVVAVKTLRPELLDHGTMRERFVREARALAKVESSAVVDVYAIGDDAVVGPYVVMEFLEGKDALALLERGPLAVDDVVTVGTAVARGLADAHGKGVLHRDIKPANLFLRGGVVTPASVVITDFGLAKDVGDGDGGGAAQLTSADIIVGTPAYLAPELARGGPASTASDLYALGATLFQLLCGRPPFEGDAPLDVLTRAVLDDAPRARSLRSDVPVALDALIASLLQKRDRPHDAADVAARFDALRTTAPSPAQTTQTLGSLPAATTTTTTTTTTASPATTTASPPPTTTTTTASPTTTAAQATAPPVDGGAGVRTATMTVMFTDIAGYTERTSRQSRDEAARWLDLHDRLLQPAFRAFGGKVVKTIGDAFLVVFTSPTDAVHCGMAIQDRLHLHNAACPAADRIDVRVALSGGEVRVRGILGVGGDIFGEPVNLAARLEGIAAAGEVVFTDAVFATMNQAEVSATPRGTHSFKGIARPVAVYAVVPVGVDGGPPFGGRALARLEHTGVGVPALLRRARSATAGLATRAVDVTQKLPRAARFAALAALIGVGVVAATVGGDDRRDAIAAGDAAAVIAEIEAIAAADRSVDDLVDYGLALQKSQRPREALVALRTAQQRGGTDAAIVDAAFDAIAAKDADVAKDILADAVDVDARLRGLLTTESWWPRHHALTVLEKTGRATDDDRQAVGLVDLRATDCAGRRYGVGLLKRAGRGDDVLKALAALPPQSNLCMLLEISPAQDAVRRRTQARP